MFFLGLEFTLRKLFSVGHRFIAALLEIGLVAAIRIERAFSRPVRGPPASFPVSSAPPARLTPCVLPTSISTCPMP